MTEHGNPIYTFNFGAGGKKFLYIFGSIFSLHGLFFLIGVLTNPVTCYNGSYFHSRPVPCEDMFFPTWSVPVIFIIVGLGIVYWAYKEKGWTVTCYADGIVTPADEFVPREKLISIDLIRNPMTSGTKDGSIWIKTSVSLKKWDRSRGSPMTKNCLILSDVPDIQDVYQKIRACYNLPGNDRPAGNILQNEINKMVKSILFLFLFAVLAMAGVFLLIIFKVNPFL